MRRLRNKTPVPNPDGPAEFTAWCERHITGDENGPAQIFLDRHFQAFGQSDCLDVRGKTEFRIPKADEDGGGTEFAGVPMNHPDAKKLVAENCIRPKQFQLSEDP
jgi:hypothetical protein